MKVKISSKRVCWSMIYEFRLASVTTSDCGFTYSCKRTYDVIQLKDCSFDVNFNLTDSFILYALTIFYRTCFSWHFLSICHASWCGISLRAATWLRKQIRRKAAMLGLVFIHCNYVLNAHLPIIYTIEVYVSINTDIKMSVNKYRLELLT